MKKSVTAELKVLGKPICALLVSSMSSCVKSNCCHTGIELLGMHKLLSPNILLHGCASFNILMNDGSLLEYHVISCDMLLTKWQQIIIFNHGNQL